MGVGPPDDAEAPDNGQPMAQQNVQNSCSATGSIISCQNQTVIEQVPIAGTPFTLVHSSERVPGHSIDRRLDVPLSGPELPDSIVAISFIIEIAGKRVEGTRVGTSVTLANLVLIYSGWDGTDKFGRKIQGRVPARVRVGYTYDCVPKVAPQFGYSGGGTEISYSGASNCKITLWEEWEKSMQVRRDPSRPRGMEHLRPPRVRPGFPRAAAW